MRVGEIRMGEILFPGADRLSKDQNEFFTIGHAREGSRVLGDPG
jgi:hypothetical protein